MLTSLNLLVVVTKFKLRTNHRGLNSITDGWNFLVNMTDIMHIKGKEEKVVDALNKRVHKMHSTTISMYKTNLKYRILEVVTKNQHYVQVKEIL
jgi:hypothetical protein